MKKTFSLEQISKKGNVDSNLITGQYKHDLMARFMEIKAVNPRLKQNQTAKELGCSSSTLQRYRNDLKMPSSHRIPPNSHKRKQNVSNGEQETDRPQLTSNDLAKHGTDTESIVERTSNKRNKNILKAGSVHENVEINGEYSDEILHNNNLLNVFSNAN